MKLGLSILFSLGFLVSMPLYADEPVNKDSQVTEVLPGEKVPVQLTHPDGTKATALMTPKDAKKFHKAKGVEACVGGLNPQGVCLNPPMYPSD